MKIRKILGHPAGKAWWISSAVLATVLIAGNIFLATDTGSNLMDIAMGAGGQVPISGETANLNYFKKTTSSKAEAKQKGDEFNITLAEEGIVMLKNKDNAFPIAKGAKVSVFGKNSVSIVYGGSGSGAVNTEEAKTLYDSLQEAGFVTNPKLKEFYSNDALSGQPRPQNPSDLDSGESVSLSTGESAQSAYTSDVKNSYSQYNDLALIVLSRIGGEGFDLPRTSSEEGKHYLELDKNEEDLIKEVTSAGFKKVAIVINSGNAMELDFARRGQYADKIDGLFLMPGTGTTGVMALGRILNGDITPSGHTVDTYAVDFTKDPSFQNFGDNSRNNGDQIIVDGADKKYYFVDYEESVYVGYRYYETRGASDEAWYQENVAYPFGFGLSYTQFDYQFKGGKFAAIEKGSKYEVEVEVTNTGNTHGKGVAQIYGHAPYHANGIEKPEFILLGFGKTKELAKGEKETLKIEIDPYLLASYDYNDANKNSFKGFELEQGEYTFSLRSDAHTQLDSFQATLAADIHYDKDPVTGVSVVNRYTDNADSNWNSDFHLQSLLSRTDWNATFPKTPTDSDRVFSSDAFKLMEDTKHNNPHVDEYTLPTQGDETSNPDLKLYSLLNLDKDGNVAIDERGRISMDWDNENWDKLLDKISVEDMKKVMNSAAFKTLAIDSIEKPLTNETDGPVGFVNFMSKSIFFGTCAYCSEVMISQTWNEALVEKFGESVGEEGLWGNNDGKTENPLPYSGWYAPGMNIHRSPFGGRNFEYFSEDPVLTGKCAAAQIRGARNKGVYTYAKHFALNEQETHRQSNGDMTFVTEQAMREIYIRPFEMAVKEGEALGIMSSFNRIGTRWTGGDYRLITEILKEEWGFHGAVLCDFNTPGYMSVKQMVYAGGDLNLATNKSWKKVDEKNAGDVTVLRKAMKHVLYMIGNSCAMNGHGSSVKYKSVLAPWRVLQITLDIVIPSLIIVSGVVIFLLLRKKEPNA